ncbi:MAG TPA: SMI1/KNR4 family protein [Bacteroidetes bacterium]|nr:SMI1/KNR4 family protein [Bacteroidota bacterium]
MDWPELLEKISCIIHAQNGHVFYDKGLIKNDWLGNSPALENEILKKEAELKIRLPESYRSFLKSSNGFRQISLFVGDLFPVQNIGWITEKEPQLIEILEDIPGIDDDISDKEYFVYGDKQDSGRYRFEYLKESLVVSGWTNGAFVLLNPKVQFGDEWEAWVYANWYPGARRYKSFKKLVLDEYNSTVELLKNKD